MRRSIFNYINRSFHVGSLFIGMWGPQNKTGSWAGLPPPLSLQPRKYSATSPLPILLLYKRGVGKVFYEQTRNCITIFFSVLAHFVSDNIFGQSSLRCISLKHIWTNSLFMQHLQIIIILIERGKVPYRSLWFWLVPKGTSLYLCCAQQASTM